MDIELVSNSRWIPRMGIACSWYKLWHDTPSFQTLDLLTYTGVKAMQIAEQRHVCTVT